MRTQPDERLSSTLKRRTKDTHIAAERVFVRAAKAGPVPGPALLIALNGALVAWIGEDVPRLEPGPLASEIALFVATAQAGQPGPVRPLPGPRLESDAAIVGAAYAVCGSALGGAALATVWRDETTAGWTGFCAASRALEERWPAFRDALDAWGDGIDAATRAAILDGAVLAFDHAAHLVGFLCGAVPERSPAPPCRAEPSLAEPSLAKPSLATRPFSVEAR